MHGSAVSSSSRGELSGRSNAGPAIAAVSGLRPPHAKQLGGAGGGAGSFADRDLQHAQQIILRRFGDKVWCRRAGLHCRESSRRPCIGKCTHDPDKWTMRVLLACR